VRRRAAAGDARADVPGVPAAVVDTTGAGDTLRGVLLAARATERFGALA
jgi:sugar/nucleoside kinase (ribokinase family)